MPCWKSSRTPLFFLFLFLSNLEDSALQTLNRWCLQETLFREHFCFLTSAKIRILTCWGPAAVFKRDGKIHVFSIPGLVSHGMRGHEMYLDLIRNYIPLSRQITPCNNLLQTDFADLRVNSFVQATLILHAKPAVSHMAVCFKGCWLSLCIKLGMVKREGGGKS